MTHRERKLKGAFSADPLSALLMDTVYMMVLEGSHQGISCCVVGRVQLL